METMINSLQPSRSEVVDIYNAVMDGIDCLILSPETAIGKYYIEATNVLSMICFEAEKHIDYIKRYNDQEKMLKMTLN